MKFGLVVHPFTDENLRLATQIGVGEVIYCDINDDDQNTERHFPEVDELVQVRDRVESFGMRLSLLETAFPMDQIIISKPGRDEQLEHFKRALGNMGKAGIEILCYDWMPTERSVIRTSYTERTRGALTNSFHLPTFESQEETPATSTTGDQMWDDLEYFLRSCLPAAERPASSWPCTPTIRRCRRWPDTPASCDHRKPSTASSTYRRASVTA